jgi:hypothetical protein
MIKVRIWIAAMLLAMPAAGAAQEAKQTSLENTLWDVDQQWLCDGPYQKPYAECVKFRSQYWADGFFEVQSGGTLRNKEEMVATQRAANPATGVRPYPADFRLMAVYGDVALGTDHTDFKTLQADGSYAFTADSHCLRVFVRQNGEWRPGGGGARAGDSADGGEREDDGRREHEESRREAGKGAGRDRSEMDGRGAEREGR